MAACEADGDCVRTLVKKTGGRMLCWYHRWLRRGAQCRLGGGG